MLENRYTSNASRSVTESAYPLSSEPASQTAMRRKQLPEITPEARRYAVKELARRAAVSKSFFEQWHIAVSATQTTVSFGRDSTARIHFLHECQRPGALEHWSEIAVARAGGFANGRGAAQADLIVPFSDPSEKILPLYEPRPDGHLTCRLDLLASIALTLSRVEETLDPQLDEHGRFPASSSVAVRQQFLERPILDEHGTAFQQAIMSLLPTWQPESRVMRLKLTHDMDDVGIPFQFRTALAHTLKRRRPAGTLRDFLARLTAGEPLELTLVRQLAAISQARGLHSAFFWKGSPRTTHDSGYSPAHPKIQRVIEDLRKDGFELGVHPGYETFHNRAHLAEEVSRLKCAIGEDYPGGRQHYLRWTPQTWLDWEYCRLRYDSSVGFADRFGFRAGTAFPYRPWCWEQNREIDLIELPLVLMDCTLVKYMHLGAKEGPERIRALLQRVKETGGVFTLLWHNTPLIDPDYDGWYDAILNLLSSEEPYQVPERPAELW